MYNPRILQLEGILSITVKINLWNSDVLMNVLNVVLKESIIQAKDLER